MGMSESNLTWTGLTASSNCYLYVDVSASGALTTGHTVTAPTYSHTAAPSTTNGAHVFNVASMKMTAGNGTTAPQVWRVFVGEAITSGSAVTGTICYAYNGRAVSSDLSFSAGGFMPLTHNLGCSLYNYRVFVVFTSAEYGYVVGEEIDVSAVVAPVSTTVANGYTQRVGSMSHSIQFAHGAVFMRAHSRISTATPAATVPALTVGAGAQLTLSSIRLRGYFTRAF
jgi:hypothetical protein